MMTAAPTDPQGGPTLPRAGPDTSPQHGPYDEADDYEAFYGPGSELAVKAKAIALDSLRALGILRKRVDRPVVGRKAYVRWWERIRALIVLAAIVVGLGVALATVIGVSLILMGTFLEQAVS